MCFEIVIKNDQFVSDEIKLPNCCGEKILRVIINNKLKFDGNIKNMC